MKLLLCPSPVQMHAGTVGPWHDAWGSMHRNQDLPSARERGRAAKSLTVVVVVIVIASTAVAAVIAIVIAAVVPAAAPRPPLRQPPSCIHMAGRSRCAINSCSDTDKQCE